MKKNYFKKTPFYLVFFSLISYCDAMEQNPPTVFLTTFEEREAIGEQIPTQMTLNEDVWFYKESESDPEFEIILVYTPKIITAENQVQPMINLKNLIYNEHVKKFIIDEYKKDPKCIAALIDKIYLKKSKEVAANWCYNLNENENDFFQDDSGTIHPCINLHDTLLAPSLRAHAENLYGQTFTQKYPMISFALISSYGALCIATLWRVTNSQHFNDASFLTKTLSIISVAASGMFLGIDLYSKLNEKIIQT